MVAIFSSIYTIFRLGQVYEDQGIDFDFKILIGIFFMQILVLTYILLAKSEQLLQGLFIGSNFFNIMGGL